jgi:plastocyanin
MTRRLSHKPARSARRCGLRAGLATLAALLGILCLSALPGSADELVADPTVKIANFTFDPPTLTVKAGTTVTWVNARRHTARGVGKGRQVPVKRARHRR